MPRKLWSADFHTTRALRVRLALLAFERPLILQSEIQGAMKSDMALRTFACRHGASLDWLYLGDLRGLHRMAQWARQPGLFGASAS